MRTDGAFQLVTNFVTGRVSKKERTGSDARLSEEASSRSRPHPRNSPGNLGRRDDRAGASQIDGRCRNRFPPHLAGRKTVQDTHTARILEMFSGVAWYEFERSEETVTFPVKLAPFQVRLLKLLDVDPTAYA